MPEQVKRLSLVIAIVAIGTLVLRFAVLPESVVSNTLHWAQAAEREASKPVKFAGASECQTCHDELSAKKGQGFHKGVACETCHGPASSHTADPSAAKPALPRDRAVCSTCHAYDPSRPTGFPQINPTTHNPLKACVSCHNPHVPQPPQTPKACAACHAQIERVKAASRHSLVECTVCHTTSQQHKVSPRSAPPSKPLDRMFCATCHGTGVAVKNAPKEAPKIDAATHGGTYACWECHHPHQPEGRK